jgi:hypothetical protein
VHSRKGFSKLSEYIPRAVSIFRRWLSNVLSIASPSLIRKMKNYWIDISIIDRIMNNLRGRHSFSSQAQLYKMCSTHMQLPQLASTSEPPFFHLLAKRKQHVLKSQYTVSVPPFNIAVSNYTTVQAWLWWEINGPKHTNQNVWLKKSPRLSHGQSTGQKARPGSHRATVPLCQGGAEVLWFFRPM